MKLAKKSVGRLLVAMRHEAGLQGVSMNRTCTLCKYTIVVLATIFLTCPHVWAGWWFLEDRGYYNPLIAEIRSANINVMFPGWSDEFPFMQKDGNRLVWDISLGKEIPIVGFNTLMDARNKWWRKDNWGVGFWIPISFHMIEDFKDDSAPIVNTDYRFSGMLKFQYSCAQSKQFGVRFQFGHESTHLGDEFTIAAQDSSPDFIRVNVSYEYWELGLSFDWKISRGSVCDPKYDTFSLRLGVIGLWNPDKGFYSDTLMFPKGQTVSPSRRDYETTIGLEYINHHTVTNKFGEPWKPFFSVELRHRTVYDYNKASSEKKDKQWSVNLLSGLKITKQASLLPGVYFRFYHGVNPHGQFRNQKCYTLYGVGLHFSG